MHGHGGGLTTIGAGAGVGADIAVGIVVEDDSPRSHILWSSEGFSLPPLTMRLVVRLAFHDLYCKYMPRIAMPAIAYRSKFELLAVPASADRLNNP